MAKNSIPESTQLKDGRRRSFFITDNEVIDDYIEQVPEVRRPEALAIYSILSRLANPEGVAFPGLQYLMKKTGRSKPIVIDALRELVVIGLIDKQTYHDEKGHKRSIYTLCEIEKGTSPGKQDLPGQVNRIDRTNTQSYQDSYETSKEVSSGIAPKLKPTPLELYITNKLNDRLIEEGVGKFTREEFAFQIGRAKHMIESENPPPPSDVEIEMLPDAFLQRFAVKGERNADVVLALRDLRAQEKRQGIINGWKKDKEDKDNGVLSDEEQERRRIAREKVAKANEEMIRRFYEDE